MRNLFTSSYKPYAKMLNWSNILVHREKTGQNLIEVKKMFRL